MLKQAKMVSFGMKVGRSTAISAGDMPIPEKKWPPRAINCLGGAKNVADSGKN